MPSTALTDLPDEILRCICFFVDWDDALSIQATCRRLVDVVTEPLLWKYHCRRTFKHWAASHHLSTKLGDATFWQWKQLFKERYEAEAKTRSALARIIASQTGRIQKIEDIVSLGYDAKDVLLREYARAMDFDDGLARRYSILRLLRSGPCLIPVQILVACGALDPTQVPGAGGMGCITAPRSGGGLVRKTRCRL